MDRPVLFGDNLFSVAQYPLHVVSADEEPAGHEAFRAADGRRSAQDYAGATTANDPWWIKAVCNRLRGANMVAIDRGSNLFGKQVQLQCSDDDFATSIQTILDVVLPAIPATGSVDDALGVRTEEGAWLARFPNRSAMAWRLNVPAMGVGLRPQVVGLWVGLSYSPAHLFRPSSPDADFMLVEESTLPSGWVGRSKVANRRQGTIQLRMQDWFEYELSRYHLHAVFGRARPTWIIHDEDQADRAVLADRAGNSELGLVREKGSNWSYPQGSIGWLEREPLAA